MAPPRKSRGIDGELSSEAPAWLLRRGFCCTGLLLLLQNTTLLFFGGNMFQTCNRSEETKLYEQNFLVRPVKVTSSELNISFEGLFEDTTTTTTTTTKLDETGRGLLPHSPLGSLRREAFWMFGEPSVKPMKLCIGLSAVKRNNSEYVFDTLKRLFSTVAGHHAAEIVVVVHLAAFELPWVIHASRRIQSEFQKEIAQGQLRGIHAPQMLYPQLDVCPPLCPHEDTPQHMKWRAKQNMDYAFLIWYSAPLAKYYLQLEDDLSFEQDWTSKLLGHVQTMPNITKDGNTAWRVIDFTGVGGLGKLIQADEAERLAQYMLLFYDQLPFDALLNRWMRAMTQGKFFDEYLKGGVKLLNHEGSVDSYMGRPHVNDVVCGNHHAPSCSGCPQGHGEGWCHGDCHWVGDFCVLLPDRMLDSPSQAPAVMPVAAPAPAPASPSPTDWADPNQACC